MFDNIDNKSDGENNSESDKNLSDKEQDLSSFAEQIAFQANLEEEQPVPNWHREEAFEQCFSDNDQHVPWWQWRGIPALSMAFSAAIIAFVLVLFKPNAEFDQQALTAMVDTQVSKKLAEQVSKQMALQIDGTVAALVDLKLREFAAEQQVILANYRADMSNKQQSNNLQLASYILKASRQERKEDIGDFVSFINAQREDEQLQQKIKFQQLEREIGFQKLNYQSNDQLDGKLPKQSNRNNSISTPLLEQS